MSTRMKVAFWCYLVSLLGPIAFGLTYLFRQDFMPYHSVAVGMPWAQVPAGFQVLILGLMRAAAGGWLALAFVLGAILVFAFRRGVAWARWAVPATGLIYSAAALYGTLYVQFNSQARAPWAVPAILIVLNIVGLLLSLGSPTRKSTSPSHP